MTAGVRVNSAACRDGLRSNAGAAYRRNEKLRPPKTLLALIVPSRFVRKPLAGVRPGFSVVPLLAKPRPHASCGIAGSHTRSQMPQGCQRFAFLFFVGFRASSQVDSNTGAGVKSRAGNTTEKGIFTHA